MFRVSRPQLLRHTQLVWLLSMLLALSPLLAQAHVWQMAGNSAHAGAMPCHQKEKISQHKKGCPHCCGKGAPLSCNCGDNLLSPSLAIEPDNAISFVLQATPSVFVSMLEAPDPPLSPHFRPPIQHQS